MAADIDIVLREVSADDRIGGADVVSWALSSWLQSNRDNGMSVGHGAPMPVYWTMHERLAKRLIRTGRLVLAHMPDAPDIFVGWACASADGRVLHYVYVKRNWRRAGVARELLSAAGRCELATHAPAPQREWCRQWLLRRGCTISPYALIEGIHNEQDFESHPADADLRARMA